MDRNGYINYHEFAHAFKVTGQPPDRLTALHCAALHCTGLRLPSTSGVTRPDPAPPSVTHTLHPSRHRSIPRSQVADLRELHSRRQTRDRGPTRSSIVSAASSAAAASSSSFVQLPPEEAGEEEAGEEADGGSGGWTDRIIQQMSNFLFQYRLELASMFRAFDVNNDGTISCQEFKVRTSRASLFVWVLSACD